MKLLAGIFTLSGIFFWGCAGFLCLKNYEIRQEIIRKNDEIKKIQMDIAAEKAKREEKIQQSRPRYLREGWVRIDNVLCTNYSWDEPSERKWRGKTAFNKSAKNDYGCATNLSLLPRDTEIYFPDINDYRITDDTFNEAKNQKLLAYWERKTHKDLVYHVDRRFRCGRDWRGVKTGVMTIYVKVKK